MAKYRITIWLILLHAALRGLSGQSYDALIGAYDALDRSTPLESMRIETDRNLYLSGEPIFFAVRGSTLNNQAFPGVSDIICVELINGQNEIVSQQRLMAMELCTHGTIHLPNNWPSGYYTMQAYTAWNRNYGKLFIAKKQVKVINASHTRAISRVNAGFQELPEYRLGLHPVYGQLLESTLNEVIVRAFTKYAMPVNGTGMVYDSERDTLSHFTTDAFGLGSFEFLPQPGMEYYLQFISAAGDTLYQGLPPALGGMGMRSICHEDRVELSVQISPDHDHEEPVNLLMARGMNIVYHQEGLYVPWEDSMALPLPEEPGIYTIFLLTDELEILARSNFYHSPRIGSLDIQTDKSLYAPRDRVGLEVDMPEGGLGNNTYSIVARKEMGLFQQNSLSFWLDHFSASLPRQRECMNMPVRDQADLDTLMQKYVHTLEPLLTPDEILETVNLDMNIPPEHGGEILSGMILDQEDNRPVSGQTVVLAFNGDGVQLHTSVTDASGRFSFHLKHAVGSRQITLCCYPPDGLKTILIDNNYIGNVSLDTLPPVLLSESDRRDLESLLLSLQVQQAYGRQLEPADRRKEPAMGNFYGEADFHLVMDRYVQLPNMEEVFFELVRGVMVNKSRGRSKLLVIDYHVPNVIGEAPLIMVDGVPFLDPDFVLRLNPENIESIRVVHYRYYLQNLSFDGIIDIRTRDGEIRSNDLPPGALSMLYHFKVPPHSPDFPDHSNDAETSGRIPDYRNLLYWNPGTREVNNTAFYTPDQPGRYVIEVTEIRDGKVTAKGSCRFEVAATKDK